MHTQVKQLVLVSSSHLVRPPEQSLSQPINFLQCKCGMDKQQTVHIIASAPVINLSTTVHAMHAQSKSTPHSQVHMPPLHSNTTAPRDMTLLTRRGPHV
eukprot:138732-Pelagomonas_calceolata.AAC.1